jgi:TonB-dependent receptor
VTESINYDLGLSYYFKPLGVFSAGVFQKDIEGFYVSRVETIQSGEFAGYQLTNPAMGTGGEIRGAEVDFQARLAFLPRWLSGLGVGANHTWLDSEGTYPNRPGVTLPFAGAPRRNWNVNVFYARGPLDVRVFVNYRSPYLDSVGARAAIDVYEDERTTLNFFFKYRLNRRTTLNLDFNNLTDSAKRSYQGDSSNPRSVRYFDWAANLRATYSL